MKEYKVKYFHAKAKKILNDIGAVFENKVEQEDFYLKTHNANIFKLQKENGDLYLVNLSLDKKGFILNLYEFLPKESREILAPIFSGNPLVLRKYKENYRWKGSVISLDRVEKFGEFIEFYPTGDEAKEEIFNYFGIKNDDLITRSYFDF